MPSALSTSRPKLGPATGVVLTDNLPANVSYIANSVILNGLAIADAVPGTLPLIAGVDENNAQHMVTYTVGFGVNGNIADDDILGSLEYAVEHLETTSAVGHRVGVTVFTNGTLLDRGTRRFLARHGIGVQISCDGVEPAQELRARGTSARLDRALSRLLKDDWPRTLEELEEKLPGRA